MNILYLSMSYVPSSRASTVQVLKMCDAFDIDGHSVVLVAKRGPQQPGGDSLQKLYGIEGRFELAALRRPSVRGGEVMYASQVLRQVETHRGKKPLVFARYLTGALYAAMRGLDVVYEAHEMPDSTFARWQLQALSRSPRLVRIVAISGALQQDLAVFLPQLPASRFVVAHDGCDEAPPQPPRHPAYASGSPLKLGYVGSLSRGKGADWVCELARQSPADEFHIVGGSPAQVSALRDAHPLPNLKFYGHIDHSKVPAILDTFDVLLLPAQNRVFGASDRNDISRWMSPLKLFEYMRAGRPIICSDLPVLREVVVDQKTALLADPESTQAWTDRIEQLRKSPELALRLGTAAREDFDAHYTWQARARAVIGGLPA